MTVTQALKNGIPISAAPITPTAGAVMVADGTSFVGSTTPTFNGVNVSNVVAAVPTGNQIWVDAVNGNDGTGLTGRFDKPFLTVAAAIAVAVAGDQIFIRPGTYTLAAGITIPASVTITGAAVRRVVLQIIGAAANTTLVTMSNGSVLENVSLNLTTTGAFSLTAVLFGGTTSLDAAIRGVIINVTKTVSADAATVAGILVQSTGAPARDFVNALNAEVVVASTGTGTNRALLMDTSAGSFNANACAFNVSGSGSRIASEINIAGGTLSMQGGSANGTTADISQTAGTLNIANVVLITNNANGLGFNAMTSTSKFVWGTAAAVSAGTRFFYPGTNTDSANEQNFRVSKPCIALNITVRSRVTPGTADTATLRKNAADTAVAVTLTNPATSNSSNANSVSFAAGDDMAMKYVRGTAGANDVQVTVELYG